MKRDALRDALWAWGDGTADADELRTVGQWIAEQARFVGDEFTAASVDRAVRGLLPPFLCVECRHRTALHDRITDEGELRTISMCECGCRHYAETWKR